MHPDPTMFHIYGPPNIYFYFIFPTNQLEKIDLFSFETHEIKKRWPYFEFISKLCCKLNFDA